MLHLPKTLAAIIDKINAASNAFLASENGKKVLLDLRTQSGRRQAGGPEDLHRVGIEEVGPVYQELNIDAIFGSGPVRK